jgi:fatty-acid desaturase
MKTQKIERASPSNRWPRVDRPPGTVPRRINWLYAITLTLVHLLSLLVFVPWFFSWTGVALFVAGHFVFGMLGITIGFHRLLTHRSFACPKWFEYSLAILGCCCAQESPVRWVAIHRMHHGQSDLPRDPHSPRAGFLWGYFGWLFFINRDHWLPENYRRYARDLLKQPFYDRLERYLLALWVYFAHCLLFFGAGFVVGWYAEGNLFDGCQFGLSLFIWGAVARSVLNLNVSWSVNAICHTWGYRNHDTPDNSRNNWLVGLVAHGDGFHNNHHARPKAAAHGRRRWELDLSYWTICLFERVGLASKVIHN